MKIPIFFNCRHVDIGAIYNCHTICVRLHSETAQFTRKMCGVFLGHFSNRIYIVVLRSTQRFKSYRRFDLFLVSASNILVIFIRLRMVKCD